MDLHSRVLLLHPRVSPRVSLLCLSWFIGGGGGGVRLGGGFVLRVVEGTGGMSY